MNFFKGYSKKKKSKRKMRYGLARDTLSLTGSTVVFGTGANVLSQAPFGSIGQQGAMALQTGSRFFPTISTINVGGRVIKDLKKLNKKVI